MQSNGLARERKVGRVRPAGAMFAMFRPAGALHLGAWGLLSWSHPAEFIPPHRALPPHHPSSFSYWLHMRKPLKVKAMKQPLCG